MVLTLVSGSLSDSPKLLEVIREGQAGDDEYCVVVKDTESYQLSYVRATIEHLEKRDMNDEHKVLGLN